MQKCIINQASGEKGEGMGALVAFTAVCKRRGTLPFYVSKYLQSGGDLVTELFPAKSLEKDYSGWYILPRRSKNREWTLREDLLPNEAGHSSRAASAVILITISALP